MSFAVQNLVWAAPLAPAVKLVLVRLSCFAANDGTNVRPSIARLAKECGACERTVQRSIRDLQTAGILIKVRDADAGAKRPCEYRIDIDALAKLGEAIEDADGCQDVTPRGDTVSPVDGQGVSQSHPYPRQDVTPRGDTVSPESSEISVNISVKEETQANKPAVVETDLLGNATLPARDDCAEAVSLWNEMADRAGLPAVARLTDKRRNALRLRLKECGGVEGWRIALAKIEASDFLRGGNDRGWKANFDFPLNPEKLTRLMEGAYDARQSQSDGQSRMRDALAAHLRRHGDFEE